MLNSVYYNALVSTWSKFCVQTLEVMHYDSVIIIKYSKSRWSAFSKRRISLRVISNLLFFPSLFLAMILAGTWKKLRLDLTYARYGVNSLSVLSLDWSVYLCVFGSTSNKFFEVVWCTESEYAIRILQKGLEVVPAGGFFKMLFSTTVE